MCHPSFVYTLKLICMSALSPILRLAQNDTLIFWCPGCDQPHAIQYGPGHWTWNQDPLRPTFTPSVLLRSGHYIPGEHTECWCSYYKEHPEKSPDFQCSVCHSFVTDGQIQYLSDSTHSLSGQTVPLPEWTSYGFSLSN